MKMRSTIIELLLILCACWTTTLAIQLPSHQKQQIVELLSEDAKPIFKSPWEELDQLQVTPTRRPPSGPTRPPTRPPTSPPTRPPTRPPTSPPTRPPTSPPAPPPRPPTSPPPPPRRSPPPPPQQPFPPPPPFEVKYHMESFETIGSTAETYNDFILKIRNRLKSPDGLAKFNIPMLRNPNKITDSNRFLLVQLSNKKDEYSTTLAVRVSDGYMVGYCCGKSGKKFTAWFFKPENQIFKKQNELLFNGKDVIKQELGFDGSYIRLGNRAGVSLGWETMGKSIKDFADTEKGKDMDAVKKAALVLIQMVSEAARYQYISDKVAAAIQSSSPIKPNPLMLSYQNNWGTLSAAVAKAVPLPNSDGDGVFKSSVQLEDDNRGPLIVTNVKDIKGVLSLLSFVKTQ